MECSACGKHHTGMRSPVSPNEEELDEQDVPSRAISESTPDMQVLRSVKLKEIDPVFLETSYYVLATSYPRCNLTGENDSSSPGAM
jgi:hypothetical protein